MSMPWTVAMSLTFSKDAARQPMQPTLYFMNTMAVSGYVSITSLMVMSSEILFFVMILHLRGEAGIEDGLYKSYYRVLKPGTI